MFSAPVLSLGSQIASASHASGHVVVPFRTVRPNTDTTAPSGTITAPDVTTNGASSETVTVSYSDDVAVAAASISTSNITVAGPNGPLSVTGVVPTPTTDSPTITAIYTVAAPVGGFKAKDNGLYTVSLTSVAGNQPTDTSGNPAAAMPATFQVNVHGISPITNVSAPNVTAVGGSRETVTVVYSDPSVAINTKTINATNLVVTANGGSSAARCPPWQTSAAAGTA